LQSKPPYLNNFSQMYLYKLEPMVTLRHEPWDHWQ
jgi:hypothetical protein